MCLGSAAAAYDRVDASLHKNHMHLTATRCVGTSFHSCNINLETGQADERQKLAENTDEATHETPRRFAFIVQQQYDLAVLLIRPHSR